jgi:hypothetical protein
MCISKSQQMTDSIRQLAMFYNFFKPLIAALTEPSQLAPHRLGANAGVAFQTKNEAQLQFP